MADPHGIAECDRLRGALIRALARAEAAERENAELRADKDRLDWWEQTGYSIRPTLESTDADDRWTMCDDSLLEVRREKDVTHCAPTIREAIDRARSPHPHTP